MNKKLKLSQIKIKKWMIFILSSCLFLTIFINRKKIYYLYSISIKKEIGAQLSNSAFEKKRIQKIVSANASHEFGFDISHYQERSAINWDSLSIGNGAIKLKYVIIRSSMGNQKKDKNFNYFWKKAKENGLIRGAYHYYRPDEDPVFQANSYLEQVKLESGDFIPILDIEKMPEIKDKEKYISDIKIWLKIVEDAYKTKPMIYSYASFYHDYLQADFADYPLWIANYNDVSEPSETADWQIWQFSEQGIVKGIKTKVDLNVHNNSLFGIKNLTID